MIERIPNPNKNYKSRKQFQIDRLNQMVDLKLLTAQMEVKRCTQDFNWNPVESSNKNQWRSSSPAHNKADLLHELSLLHI